MSASTVTTEVEVANLALDLVKEAPITSFDENRAPARWMARNFKPVSRMVLTTHIWKFAMKRAVLPADNSPPAFEWRYQYRKPPDALRVLPLRYGGQLNGRLVPHVVEGDFILTDLPAPIQIKYLAAKDNVAEWPPVFVEAVAAKLAARIAHFMTGKQSMVEVNEALFRQALQMAVSIDGAEGTHSNQYATTYDDARYYYSGWGMETY
jgi:hypothetical protein